MNSYTFKPTCEKKRKKKSRMYTWAKSWEAEEKKEKKGERERRTVSE